MPLLLPQRRKGGARERGGGARGGEDQEELVVGEREGRRTKRAQEEEEREGKQETKEGFAGYAQEKEIHTLASFIPLDARGRLEKESAARHESFSITEILNRGSNCLLCSGI